MKKTIAIVAAAAMMLGCKKEIVVPQTQPAKKYKLLFSTEEDMKSTYLVQTSSDGSTWKTVASVPDTSKTGDYVVPMTLAPETYVRALAIQGTDTTASTVMKD